MGQESVQCLCDGLNSKCIGLGIAKASATWEFHVGNHETFVSGAKEKTRLNET